MPQALGNDNIMLGLKAITLQINDALSSPKILTRVRVLRPSSDPRDTLACTFMRAIRQKISPQTMDQEKKERE